MKLKFEELIADICKVSGCTKPEARGALITIVLVIKDRTTSGADVRIPGLGTFRMVERKAGIGRNPKTGETVALPASRRLKFSPAKATKSKE